jgi:superfamily II DNA or RNA helicase
VEIKIISPIHIQLSRDLKDAVSGELTFQGEYWKKGVYRMEKHTYPKHLVSKDGYTYAGFLPRILKQFHDVIVTDKIEPVESYDDANNFPLKLRSDQIRLVNSAIKMQRGVIIAPTGSGKTVLAGAIISRLKSPRAVFLCHTKTLVTQTYREFVAWGIDCGMYYGEEKNLSSPVTVATIQSFSKLSESEQNYFDTVIVDECHHISGLDTVYAKTLMKLFCRMRLGFTATLPTKKESVLTIEGLLGPVIDELTLEEGMEEGILARPVVYLKPVKEIPSISDLNIYKEIYEHGIVKNRYRNNVIAQAAIDIFKQKMSTLIMVREIEHGKLLKDIFDVRGIDAIFVQGSTDGETRELVKKSLNDMDIKIVISTAIWYEGVNIPSLCCIINACGGKSDIRTIQVVGRGLRTTEEKTEILIIDFLDPYKYLAQHTIQRIRIYVENGWM